MKDMYTTLERTLIAVFGLYLLGAAAIVINSMMQQGSTEVQMFWIVAAFVAMWLTGGVIMPAVIKSYEINRLMSEIGDIDDLKDLGEKIQKSMKNKKKKKGKK
jgi:hypothetical protein